MAQSQLAARVPLKAASAMGAYRPITFLAGGSALSETIIPAGSFNDFQFGLTSATVASPGDPISWWQPGDVGKGIAGASMGAGAFVSIGSTNGILIPQVPSAAATAMALRWTVGIVLKNAVAGDFIPVFIKPDQIV